MIADEDETVAAVLVAAGESPARLLSAIRSVATQDVPVDELRLAVPTTEVESVAETVRAAGVSVVVVDNPTGGRSAGLNLAVRGARARYICRIDARSTLPPDYVRRCRDRLASAPTIGVVGGRQLPVPGGAGVIAHGIARALGNPWAMGGAAYRRGRQGAVDTAYLGFFRRAELIELGGWDVRLRANEDFDLCRRYIDRGLKVWLEGGLDVRYEARTSLRDLHLQYRAFGVSKVAFWRTTGARPSGRQVAAILAAGAAAAVGVTTVARRPPWLVASGLGAAAALSVVDAIGAAGAASIGERAAADLAYLTIWSSWLSGLVEGWSEAAE